MNKFGDAFKAARIQSDKTFREIAAYIGKSIGYVSDIETGRKNPPEDDVVRRLETILEIKDGSLRRLAAEVRKILPSNLPSMVQAKPLLGDALLRMDELPPERVREYIKEMEKDLAKFRKSKDDLLFLHDKNLVYLEEVVDEDATSSYESCAHEPGQDCGDYNRSSQGVLPWCGHTTCTA